jgi:hypothetical protein
VPGFSRGIDGSLFCRYLFLFAWLIGNRGLFPGWSPLKKGSWSPPKGPAVAGAGNYCYWSTRCIVTAGSWPPSPALPLCDY